MKLFKRFAGCRVVVCFCTGNSTDSIFSAVSYNIQMTHKFFALLASLTLLLPIAITISPASNCLGNCIACSDSNPLLCRPLLNSTSGKEYSCLAYYTGSNCQQTAAAYFNLYNETSNFANWSLPTPPPPQTCKLLPSASSNNTFSSNATFPAIGPFSSSLNASKSLSFSAAQNVQRLVIKISVAVADAVLYNGSVVANESTTETTDAQGNIIIEIVSTNNKKSALSTSIPFLKVDVTDQLNSNSLLASFSTTYSAVSTTNTSCGFVYQYEFVVDAASNPLRQIRLNFYLSTANSQTTWYLLGFSAEAGCSGFSVTSGNSKCSTCLSGFYPVSDPDGALQSCNVCDYRCITCSSSSVCLLCEAYTTSPVAGKCDYPESYGVYRDFQVMSGRKLSLSPQAASQFSSVASSQAQLLNLGLDLLNNQSYLIKFHLLYSLSYAQNLSQLNITVNGKPHTTLNSLDFLASTLLQQANGASAQLFATPIKIDLMGKPCLQNFTIGLRGSSQSNEQFYVANMVLVQYSCGQNCLNCVFSTSQSNTCTQCKPFFSLAQNCKTCANGFFLKDNSVCVKCYSNCKQCSGPAMHQCTECLSSFTLGEMTLDRNCIPCLFDFWNGTMVNCNALCPQNYTISQLQFNSNCSACLKANKNQMYSSAACMSCWIFLGIGSGKCVPTSASGYVFYSNDLISGRPGSDLWTGSENLTAFTCTSDYVNIYGIGQSQNHTVKTPSSLNYTLTGLPAHRGVTLVFNIFKIDDWILEGNSTSSVINITVNSPGYQGNTFNIKLTNQFGSNICGGSGREMIWAMQATLKDHTSNQVTMTVYAPDKGIFVRQLQVYLGSCPNCDEVGLAYQVFAIPMYSDNDTQTGLDLWITFNHPVYYSSQGNSTPTASRDAFANSFRFSVDGAPIPNASLTSNQIATFNYLKYFLPLSQSYKNATLTVNTSSGDLVYTSDGSVNRQLVSSSYAYILERYDYASADTRRSTQQLSTFFLIFTWFTLICMIVTVMLNVGVLFQEFSLMMQLIYYHIYITSPLLPPTLKVPLSHAVRMEHLNYFADISAIERNLFGDLVYPSDYIFQQFNIDVYFLRSFYPILIINAIYIGWFIINAILYRLLPACRQSESKIFRFLRSIPQRPLAYFDQLWRYQFLATMWACMLQFTHFRAEGGGQAVNLLICVLAFSVSIVWPFVVTIYTYRKHFVMSVNHFRYSYHDLYYLKISSVADEPKYYLYVGVRFGKLLGYAIFIALFVNQSIIGPVLLIFFNIIEGVVAYFLEIYRSAYYLFTRIVENLLLCIAAILCLIIYANRNSLNQDSYENLGYGLATVFVLMIVNGICRFGYLIYKKAYEWKIGTYDVGEQGEKEDYEGKGPIRLAQTERV